MSEPSEERKLTQAEEKRQRLFEATIERLRKQGYAMKDLTVEAKKANLWGSLYGLLLAVLFAIPFFFLLPRDAFHRSDDFIWKYVILIVSYVAAIVVHELIHGATWAMFTPDKWKNISFGVLWKTLNPYCTCNQPLTRGQYLAGLLAPCVVLGLVPCVVSWFNHSGWILAFGFVMTMSAGGDLLIGSLILKTRTPPETLYYDHPTQIGLVLFEKNAD